METLTFLISGTLLAGTPLLIAALGELAVEKAGVLNLSVEGMMALGAVIGFIVATHSGNYWLAMLAGGLAAMALSAVFGFVVLYTLGNQVASGLAVGIMGLGLSGLIGGPYEGATIAPMARLPIPGLSTLPLLGPSLFNQVALVYIAPLLAAATWWLLSKSKVGLMLRAVGEAPEAAHAIGYNVVGVRFLAVLYGGFWSGVAGAFISVASATLWSDGIIAGRGWIVIALVVFGTWRPGRIAIGAYLFGASTLAGLLVQSTGVAIPSQLLTSLPYIVTIFALTVLSMDAQRIRLNAPVSLGKIYHESR